jgi:hypothetical protein
MLICVRPPRPNEPGIRDGGQRHGGVYIVFRVQEVKVQEDKKLKSWDFLQLSNLLNSLNAEH